MKVYVTKWVGVIKEMEGSWAIEDASRGDRWFRAVTGPRPWDYALLHHKHVHEYRIDAIDAAKAQRDKRIASLRKQIAKLEALDFSEVDRG